jgi:hypothetical protein
MRAFFKKIICTAKVFTDGMMAVNLVEVMSTTSWRDTVYSLGKMDENTLVDTKMIKNAEMVHSSGQMAGNTLALGKTANNMVKEFISTEVVMKERAPGKLVKE